MGSAAGTGQTRQGEGAVAEGSGQQACPRHGRDVANPAGGHPQICIPHSPPRQRTDRELCNRVPQCTSPLTSYRGQSSGLYSFNLWFKKVVIINIWFFFFFFLVCLGRGGAQDLCIYLTFDFNLLEAVTFVRIQWREHFFCSTDTRENTKFKLFYSITYVNKITRKSCFTEKNA